VLCYRVSPVCGGTRTRLIREPYRTGYARGACSASSVEFSKKRDSPLSLPLDLRNHFLPILRRDFVTL